MQKYWFKTYYHIMGIFIMLSTNDKLLNWMFQLFFRDAEILLSVLVFFQPSIEENSTYSFRTPSFLVRVTLFDKRFLLLGSSGVTTAHVSHYSSVFLRSTFIVSTSGSSDYKQQFRKNVISQKRELAR